MLQPKVSSKIMHTSVVLHLQAWGVRRCGADDARVRAAFAALASTVYRANQSNFEHHLAYCGVALPLAADGWNQPVIRPGFAAAPLAQAWKLLIDAAPSCPGRAILFDVVDVGREFLSLFPCLQVRVGDGHARHAPSACSSVVSTHESARLPSSLPYAGIRRLDQCHDIAGASRRGHCGERNSH